MAPTLSLSQQYTEGGTLGSPILPTEEWERKFEWKGRGSREEARLGVRVTALFSEVADLRLTPGSGCVG